MPKRIQLSRTKGWRKPEGAVVVTRNTGWGNPFRVGAEGIPDRATAVARFREIVYEDTARSHFYRLAAVEELRGRDLCCWCPLDEPCHADVLLELANS